MGRHRATPSTFRPPLSFGNVCATRRAPGSAHSRLNGLTRECATIKPPAAPVLSRGRAEETRLEETCVEAARVAIAGVPEARVSDLTKG